MKPDITSWRCAIGVYLGRVTGVLAIISGLLSPKTCPCAPTINSRNLLLTKTNQATIRQNCVFSPFIYIQKWKIRPRSKDMGFGARRKKKKFTSYGTMFLTDFIELYSTETHSKALNSIHMIYLSTMSNSMPLSRGLRLVYASTLRDQVAEFLWTILKNTSVFYTTHAFKSLMVHVRVT